MSHYFSSSSGRPPTNARSPSTLVDPPLRCAPTAACSATGDSTPAPSCCCARRRRRRRRACSSTSGAVPGRSPSRSPAGRQPPGSSPSTSTSGPGGCAPPTPRATASTTSTSLAPDDVDAALRFDLIWSNPPIRIGKEPAPRAARRRGSTGCDRREQRSSSCRSTSVPTRCSAGSSTTAGRPSGSPRRRAIGCCERLRPLDAGRVDDDPDTRPLRALGGDERAAELLPRRCGDEVVVRRPADRDPGTARSCSTTASLPGPLTLASAVAGGSPSSSRR